MGTEGGSRVGVIGTVALTVLLLAVTALLLYAMIACWPPEAAPGQILPPTSYTVTLFTWSGTISREMGLFVIVGTLGALGGIVHSLRSLYAYVGSRELLWSWVPMYPLIPVVATVLAVIFYVVLRGGLIAGEASSTSVSPFGFGAVAALVGLFSEQAVLKLKDVFNTLFRAAPQRADSLPPDPDDR